MTITELGAIGELMGGVAVLLTLAYLAMQLRQANSLARAESARMYVEQYRTAWAALTDPERMDLFRRALRDFDAMHKPDQARAHILVWSIFYAAEIGFSLNRFGLNIPHLAQGVEEFHADMIRSPGFSQWWNRLRTSFTPAFVEHLDTLVNQRGNFPAFHEKLSWYWPDDLGTTES